MGRKGACFIISLRFDPPSAQMVQAPSNSEKLPELTLLGLGEGKGGMNERVTLKHLHYCV